MGNVAIRAGEKKCLVSGRLRGLPLIHPAFNEQVTRDTMSMGETCMVLPLHDVFRVTLKLLRLLQMKGFASPSWTDWHDNSAGAKGCLNWLTKLVSRVVPEFKKPPPTEVVTEVKEARRLVRIDSKGNEIFTPKQWQALMTEADPNTVRLIVLMSYFMLQ